MPGTCAGLARCMARRSRSAHLWGARHGVRGQEGAGARLRAGDCSGEARPPPVPPGRQAWVKTAVGLGVPAKFLEAGHALRHIEPDPRVEERAGAGGTGALLEPRGRDHSGQAHYPDFSWPWAGIATFHFYRDEQPGGGQGGALARQPPKHCAQSSSNHTAQQRWGLRLSQEIRGCHLLWEQEAPTLSRA